MPTIDPDRGWQWWLEQVLWAVLVGVPVGASLMMLWWLAISGG